MAIGVRKIYILMDRDTEAQDVLKELNKLLEEEIMFEFPKLDELLEGLRKELDCG